MTKIKHFNPMALREKYGIGTKSNDSNSSFWMDDTYGRRTSIFDGWDDEYTMTLDCKKLLLGINGPPKVAITPKSLGEEVFKKAC